MEQNSNPPKTDVLKSKEQLHTVHDLIDQTGWIIYHGTSQGRIQNASSTGEVIDYMQRDAPPEDWQKKIKFCLNNKPSISAGRVIYESSNPDPGTLWSPVGLLVSDGIIVGTGGQITGPDGHLIPVGGGEQFPYSPTANSSELARKGVALYELGIEQPVFKAIYISSYTQQFRGSAYDKLYQQAVSLSKEVGLPLVKITREGTEYKFPITGASVVE
ncbi:MAG: hypothetical protein M3Q44_01285 [bacterium]|nr:hypothetical protein [bacterium]